MSHLVSLFSFFTYTIRQALQTVELINLNNELFKAKNDNKIQINEINNKIKNEIAHLTNKQIIEDMDTLDNMSNEFKSSCIARALTRIIK